MNNYPKCKAKIKNSLNTNCPKQAVLKGYCLLHFKVYYTK